MRQKSTHDQTIELLNKDSEIRGRVTSLIEEYLETSNLTLYALAESITGVTGLKVYRKTMNPLIEHLGYKKKDKSKVLEAKSKTMKVTAGVIYANYVDNVIKKVNAIGYSLEELKADAEANLSYLKLTDKYSISQYEVTRLVEEYGWNRSSSAPIDYKKTIPLLEAAGFGKDKLYELYVEQNMKVDEFDKVLSDALGFSIGEKRRRKILSHFNIIKTPDQVRELQATRSKAQLVDNMAKIHAAGFNSIEELAVYYEENTHVTPRALLEIINKDIDNPEDYITNRWLSRHMYPLLSKTRLGSVSRSELEMLEYVKSLIGDRYEVLSSHRKLIAPQEVDIYIPELDLAFEFNGDYWHSDEFIIPNHGMTADEYHELKRTRCLEKGVHLFFIWESDWNDKHENSKADLKLIIDSKIASQKATL